MEQSFSLWLKENITTGDIRYHGVNLVLEHRQSDYQDILIVETAAHGKVLFLDQDLQLAASDEFLYHEALVHPALLLHPNPKKVLILGGGDGGSVREVLRWNSVNKVTLLEIDLEVVKACQEHLPEVHQHAFDDPRCELIIGDALKFIEQNDEQWDVIIADLTDPAKSELSCPFFTQDYFSAIQSRLGSHGVLAMQAGPCSPTSCDLFIRIVKTLKLCFPDVQPYAIQVPSFTEPWGLAVASPNQLDLNFDVDQVNQILDKNLNCELKMLDGHMLTGLFKTPLYLRNRLKQESSILTL